ncbi:carbamate kinase [Oribacterium sp. oral taxon 078 str. F0263]|uniref:carbamate kinase n=1 Tax=Oribacterium sp. oral taxon 078 TaxID=652706 RepID=UPI0003AE4014|nr:carbamate kinase [Oribacterium sp. oral taxon 078]ERL22093.1 carbamate kinase [Oribacterium sp. oral taxon 078 str. F0263]
MDKKKIVIALGGNALGNNLPEQMEAVKTTAKAIVDLAEDGNEIVIVHGNGPQVGVINNAMTEFAHKDGSDPTPLSVCVAMSQAYIGYDIQNALREEFLNRGAKLPPVATMVTQVRVDPEDPAFRDPSKPIGRFMAKDEALKEAGDRGWIVREDAGRGYRRVVASPKPKEIIELSAIRAMADDGQIVICCGGGGIPVVAEGKHLAGVPAVIDKDFAAELLAESLDADMLLILTAVEKAAVHFGKPEQRWLSEISAEEAERYAEEGQFAAGSMLPKVQAAIRFARSRKGRTAVITLLEKAREALQGKTGTRICEK